MSFDWKATIGTVAPALAGVFGSPVAGMAVGALCKAFGLEPSAENAQKIAQQAADGTLSGADWTKIKQAEIEMQATLLKMNLEYSLSEDKLVAADRDSARNRQIQLRDKTPQILAYLGLFVWSLLNGVLMYMAYRGKSLPVDMSPLIMRVLGTMDALLGMAFAFFFGTTANSARKDELLHQSTPTDGVK